MSTALARAEGTGRVLGVSAGTPGARRRLRGRHRRDQGARPGRRRADAVVLAEARVRHPPGRRRPGRRPPPAPAPRWPTPWPRWSPSWAARSGGRRRRPRRSGWGSPGMVDRHGVLRFAPNLPGRRAPTSRGAGGRPPAGLPRWWWRTTPTAPRWPSARIGAARGVDDAVVVTLGTGHRRRADQRRAGAWSGPPGFAGEIGHMVVDPSGRPARAGGGAAGSASPRAAGSGRLAREAAHAGRLAEVVALAGGDPEAVRGEHVTGAATAGDAGALAVLDELGWWVALGPGQPGRRPRPVGASCSAAGWSRPASSCSARPGGPSPSWSRGRGAGPRSRSWPAALRRAGRRGRGGPGAPGTAGCGRAAGAAGGGGEDRGHLADLPRRRRRGPGGGRAGPRSSGSTGSSASTTCGPWASPSARRWPPSRCSGRWPPSPRRVCVGHPGGPGRAGARRGAGGRVRRPGGLAPGRLVAGLGTGDHLSAAENAAYGIPFAPARRAPGGAGGAAPGRCAAPASRCGWAAGRRPTVAVAEARGRGGQPVGGRPDGGGRPGRPHEVTWAGPAAAGRPAAAGPPTWPP